jgi:hypothetical protein
MVVKPLNQNYNRSPLQIHVSGVIGFSVNTSNGIGQIIFITKRHTKRVFRLNYWIHYSKCDPSVSTIIIKGILELIYFIV